MYLVEESGHVFILSTSSALHDKMKIKSKEAFSGVHYSPADVLFLWLILIQTEYKKFRHQYISSGTDPGPDSATRSDLDLYKNLILDGKPTDSNVLLKPI